MVALDSVRMKDVSVPTMVGVKIQNKLRHHRPPVVQPQQCGCGISWEAMLCYGKTRFCLYIGRKKVKNAKPKTNFHHRRLNNVFSDGMIIL